jgi:hypothetical protein
VKAYSWLIPAALIAVAAGSALAAPRHATAPAHKAKAAAASGQTWSWGRCSVRLPKGWGDYRGGKASPKDHDFNVTLGGASSSVAMASTLKAMHGHTIEDGKDLTVTRVNLRRRGSRQYWAVTKSTPACRATVTYGGPDQEAAARKIAQSLKRRR